MPALADEVEGMEESERPAQRLAQLSVDLDQVNREIAELTQPYEAELANWIASGSEGDRPQPSLRIAGLEHRRALLVHDVAAVMQCTRGSRTRASAGLRTRETAPG
jgi:hypothetical protein